MKRIFALVGVVALFLIASGLLLAQANLEVGTWKLNVAKSKSTPAGLVPRSGTAITQPQATGVKVSMDGVAFDGSRIAYSYSTNYDGKDSAISWLGSPDGPVPDTVAVKRIDANTTTAALKIAGEVVLTSRTVVSRDGKFMTVTTTGTSQQITVTTVWEKRSSRPRAQMRVSERRLRFHVVKRSVASHAMRASSTFHQSVVPMTNQLQLLLPTLPSRHGDFADGRLPWCCR